jgi:A118 family predicted phage portal protein
MNRGGTMRFTKMLTLITEVLSKDSDFDIQLTSDMANQIELYSSMYRNRAPWVNNKTVFSCNLPAAISSELARLTMLEFDTEITGSTRGTYLNGPYQKTINTLRQYIEYALAKGSMALKPYVTKDGITVQFVQADCFFPVSFDSSGNVAKCVFTEQFRSGKKIYTRLEIHDLINGKLTITNRAFVATNDITLGSEISIGEVDRWSELEYEVVYENVSKLPFGYFKVPLANNHDSESPIGVSVYSRAVGLIQKADERYSQIDWEYVSKESAVHIADSLMKYNQNLAKYEYPGGMERLYRIVEYSTGATDKPLIDTYSPEIRDQSLYNGFNHQLRLVEFNAGLAYGTLSDPNNTDKTAEEIKTSKKRSFDTVSDIQKALQRALTDMIDAMDFYATIYQLAPRGNYETSFNWGDSILIDKEKELLSMQQDVTANLIRPELYLAKKYGVSEEEALKMMPNSNATDLFQAEE